MPCTYLLTSAVDQRCNNNNHDDDRYIRWR